MALIVDITHWLDTHGGLPASPPLRKKALRIVQLIEAGGPLKPLYGRETLLCCLKRLGRKACPGFVWVVKLPDARIEAHCPTCHRVEAVVSGWQETLWADGPMPPVKMPTD